MDNWFNVLCLLALILLNGVFAMSEIALVTSRKPRLQVRIDEGNRGAKVAMRLNEEPTRALSAIQVGITSIGILSGIVGEAALATPVAAWLNAEFNIPMETARFAGLLLVVVLVTYFSIVLGELVPKRLGQMNPEGVACRIAPPINFLAVLMAPFVKLLSVSTDLLLKLSGKKGDEEQGVTEEEIHAIIDEGSETGAIEEQERDMVRNVFRLDDRTVASLMTPRSEVEWIDLQEDARANVAKLLNSRHSRLPIADGSLDDIKGFCSTRYLLQQIVENGHVDFTSKMASVLYVPESLSGLELLENFRANDVPVAIVVDEYGTVQGLVSPRDVLEAIAGEFKPEPGEEAWAVERDDGSGPVDGDGSDGGIAADDQLFACRHGDSGDLHRGLDHDDIDVFVGEHRGHLGGGCRNGSVLDVVASGRRNIERSVVVDVSSFTCTACNSGCLHSSLVDDLGTISGTEAGVGCIDSSVVLECLSDIDSSVCGGRGDDLDSRCLVDLEVGEVHPDRAGFRVLDREHRIIADDSVDTGHSVGGVEHNLGSAADVQLAEVLEVTAEV